MADKLSFEKEKAYKHSKIVKVTSIDDDVTDVYHNAEFPEGWEE